MLRRRQSIWLPVLAAGRMATLGHLTTDREGRAVPKQFCSLNGGHSLLQASLRRARRIAPARRICVVVDRGDERYWRPMLQALPEGNIIVQPRNCGAGNGLLLGVLTILERDPRARVVVMPADHHVLEERVLVDSVRRGLDSLYRDREGCLSDRLLLLGFVPDEGDAALSYVVPGEPIGVGTRDVAQFVSGPPAGAARDLLGRGALYDSCILAADGTSIVECIRERYPQIVAGMASRLGASRLAEFYQNLPALDWEQVGGQGSEAAFCVFTRPGLRMERSRDSAARRQRSPAHLEFARSRTAGGRGRRAATVESGRRIHPIHRRSGRIQRSARCIFGRLRYIGS